MTESHQLPSPFDPDPPPLRPDPIDGTRDGWEWCAGCGGVKPPGHGEGCERVAHFVQRPQPKEPTEPQEKP